MNSLKKEAKEIDFYFNPGYKKDFNDLLKNYKNKKINISKIYQKNKKQTLLEKKK